MSKKQLIAIIERQEASLKHDEILTAKQAQRIDELETENKLLRQKMDLLIRKVFGVSSEKLDAAQLDLFLAQPENAPGKPVASSALEEAKPSLSRKSSHGRNRWPQDLPVVEEVLDPEEVIKAPEAWRCIGQEVSEQLDYEPAKFFKRRLIRRKFIARQELDATPIIAPLPPLLQERLSIAPGLLTHIVIAKYCDHLPLYRQEQIFWQRHRVWLPRQNLDRWIGLVADWVRPIYDVIRSEVQASGYMQVDETPIRYLSPGHGQTKLGYFWTSSHPGGDVVYQWETSRAAQCLDKIIPINFRGTLQCDGYQAYASFARNKKDLQLAACWAHYLECVFMWS